MRSSSLIAPCSWVFGLWYIRGSPACLVKAMIRVRETGLQASAGEWTVVRTERVGTETPSTGYLSITVTDRYSTEFSWVRENETATGELFVDVRPNPERISLWYAMGSNQGVGNTGCTIWGAEN